jgi:hypothetical protein
MFRKPILIQYENGGIPFRSYRWPRRWKNSRRLKLPHLLQNPNASAIPLAHTSHLCSAEPILSTGANPCIAPGQCLASLPLGRMMSHYSLGTLTSCLNLSAL